MERMPFDINSFINVILGITESNKHNCCWGNNDYKIATNGRGRLDDDREGKDYNSFGETKKIDF